MIIEIPGCGFRIKGTATDWQVQYPVKERKDGKGDGWAGKYFFPSFEHAVAKAHELTLRESPEAAPSLDAALAECRRVKDGLFRGVKKALKEAV